MPRTRRDVKERDPKAIRFAFSLMRPIWGLALLYYGGINAGPLFFPSSAAGRTSQLYQTPLIVAFVVTVLVFAAAVVVVKIQNAVGKSLEALQDMAPEGFEDWVASRFRDLGYSVWTAGAQGDHGVDLVVEKPGELAIVQCKNFKRWSVGEPVLRDLYGAMHDFGADRAYLVTTGRVTQTAVRWAEGKPIEIWDADEVSRLSKRGAAEQLPLFQRPWAELAASPAPTPAPAPEAISRTPAVTEQSSKALVQPVPTCPRCGSKLVTRHNRATDEPFLGCSGFPACRYTRPMPKPD